MKWLLYALVVINLLMFAWFSQYQPSRGGAHSETSRNEIPRGTGTISLLSEIEPVMKVAVQGPEPSRPVAMCHNIGPFANRAAADEVLAGLRELGKEGSLRSVKSRVKTGYWVYLKSMPAQAVEGVIQELEQKGITDYHRNEHNELSLGIYNRHEGAERRRQSIAALGYEPLVEPLFRDETRYWIDVREIDAEQLSDEAWNARLANHPGLRHQSEQCTLTNV